MALKSTKHIYLDYAATTPVDSRALKAMEPYFGTGAHGGKFGNPGSLHSFGQEAIAAVDHARETVARAMGAEFREIIFTGSATETNNLALRGAVASWRAAHSKGGTIKNPRIIISTIEHESVLETARELERDGVEVIYVPVDRHGVVDLAHIKKSLNEQTVLVSVMYANNEIGTIQPIAEIAKIIRVIAPQALFHSDASQALQFLDCDVNALGVDLMTLSSHKIYGPKGAASLYIKNAQTNRKNNLSGRAISPLVFGGGQEYGMRSGTENVPAIAGFAKAVELAGAARTKESKRIAALRDQLWRGIKKICPDAERNGDADHLAKNNKAIMATMHFLPNILNVYFPGHAAQDLLTRFDLAGLAVSSGSACRSRAFESSYVIEALGFSNERAKSSVRFSLGRPTTKTEIDKSIAIIQNVLRR